MPNRRRFLNDNERNTFTRSLGFMSVFDLTDTAQAAIASASERGHKRVAELSASPGSLDTLADEIQLDGWRRRALQWALTNDPAAVPGYFTMTDYLRLGNGVIASDWAGWGMAGADCHCLRLPSRFEWWAATDASSEASWPRRSPISICMSRSRWSACICRLR